MSHSDRDILRAINTGQSWAVGLISEAITPLIKRMVYSYDDWEDVRQEALTRITETARKLDPSDIHDLKSYFRGITTNTVVAHNRRFRLFRDHHDFADESDRAQGGIAGAPDPAPLPDETFELEDLFIYVYQRLGKICQRIVDGLVKEGLTPKELAQALEISDVNFRVRWMRCRQEMRALREQAAEY